MYEKIVLYLGDTPASEDLCTEYGKTEETLFQLYRYTAELLDFLVTAAQTGELEVGTYHSLLNRSVEFGFLEEGTVIM